MLNFKLKNLSLSLIATFALTGCGQELLSSNDSIDSTTNVAPKTTKSLASTEVDVLSVEQVLSQVNECNETIVIRSQALTSKQIEDACKMLIAQEKNFHQIFGTEGKPVADDNNLRMRANVYSHREQFVKHATNHFNMPTDNGGMYLEGYPERKGNQAEFVAYQKNGQVWNLKHEYVHYLDGRFNKYGDYCNGLHDDHAGPEFCATPHLAYPHIVWWAEGVAEYIAHGKNNDYAAKVAQKNSFKLSELFNTSSNENTGGERVYSWGYLAVRFMMENHRDDVDEMLALVRAGNWAGYQALVKNWNTSFDAEFEQWLLTLSPKNAPQELAKK